jgi:hypothetical protein
VCGSNYKAGKTGQSPVSISSTVLTLPGTRGYQTLLPLLDDTFKENNAENKIRESELKFRMSFMTSLAAFYIGTLDEEKIIDAVTNPANH